MIKLNTKNQPLTVAYASQSQPGTARRFVVPISNPDTDVTAVTQRVWELANETGADVKFLGICNDAKQELSLRRTLVTMNAMVCDENVHAESKIVFGKDFVGTVKSQLQPGDTVVCAYNQRSGALRKPFLQTNFGVPVLMLSEPYPRTQPRSNWPAQIIAWVGFASIIIGFLLLQVKIADLARGWTAILQLLSIAVELKLVLFWNSLLG